jgi:xylan 1,4-beta-xylosidase
MIWDHRPNRSFFGGIFLQEYSVAKRTLVGDSHNIFAGSPRGLTEGPHLYRRGDYYYLLTAEGGTGYDHAMTLARSRSITGPYELDPAGHFVTASDVPDSPLQRCGHGDWVETPAGEVYGVHLCSRPLSRDLRRSPMGRETALEPLAWNNQGWLRVKGGGPGPRLELPAPALRECAWEPEPSRSDFQEGALPSAFQWLRTPEPDHLFSLVERPGYLRLRGRESLGSLYSSALVARRQTAFAFEASTCMEFDPQHFQQMAGLVCYYNGHKFHYLYLSHDEQRGRHLGIMSCQGDLSLAVDFPLQEQLVSLPGCGEVYLRATVDRASLRFSWSLDGEAWRPVGDELDYSVLSDEVGKGEGASFTGAFVGMCCQDIAGTALPADFGYFEYSEHP